MSSDNNLFKNSYSNFASDQYNNQNPHFNSEPNQYNPHQYTENYPYPTTHQPYEDKYEHVGDFSHFYIAITICCIIGFTLIIVNVALGCCSRYSEYWNDRHTGNRWILSLWTATPHKQPALEYSSELQDISVKNHVVYHHPQEEIGAQRSEFLELGAKRESEI